LKKTPEGGIPIFSIITSKKETIQTTNKNHLNANPRSVFNQTALQPAKPIFKTINTPVTTQFLQTCRFTKPHHNRILTHG